MGLVQRKIEAAGFSTISLSNIPDLTAVTGVPRLAGIEYPETMNVGRPGDYDGQMAVLRATLAALVEIAQPGGLKYLPMKWAEPPEKVNTHPLQSPPIVQHIKRHPWDLLRFIRRDPPGQESSRQKVETGG